MTLTQNGATGTQCTITAGVSKKPVGVLPSGGSGAIAVTADNGCSWTATSDSTWLTVAAGNSGVGMGEVQWSAAANSSARRTGTITIASSNAVNQAVLQTGAAPVSLGLASQLTLNATSTSRGPSSVSGSQGVLSPRASSNPLDTPVAAGTVVRFSDQVTNRGTGNATTSVTCTLDPSLAVQSCGVSGQGNCNPGSGSVNASLGLLGSGQSATLTFNALVSVNLPNGRTLTTTCQASATEGNATPDDSLDARQMSVVPPSTPSYTLALALDPVGGGTITADPASGTATYLSGTAVDLTAVPAPGYQFVGWQGDVTGNASPQTVVMSKSQSVRAVFAPLPGAGLRFVGLTPCRVVDTRNAVGPFGGPMLPASGVRDFPVSASSCGVPGTALAYSLNVTVVPRGNLGYLSLWPSGQPQPLVSTLNSDGRIKANAAIIPAGANGSIRAFVTDPTDLVVDINGYFVPTPASADALQFYPVPPCRISDTRDPLGPYGGPALTAGQVRSVAVVGRCGIPASARAFSLNFTAVPYGVLNYLTVWPTGQSQPYVSTLNSPRGVNLANAALVPAGTNGAISLYVTDTTHMVIDVNGYFAPPGSGGLSFYSMSPCRITDTRNPSDPTFGGPMMGAGEDRTFPVSASNCAVPFAAQAYVLNTTVVPSGSLGYLTMFPTGTGVPLVSTLNAPDGSITSAAALVPAGTKWYSPAVSLKAVDVFVTNASHVIFDISGYFAP